MAEGRDQKIKVSETNDEKEKPKDLLQNFSVEEEKPRRKLIIKEENNPEINLGLSLGGIYCENSNKKGLPRSCSLTGMMKVNKEENEEMKKPLSCLSRSCSVLTEAEHEQRKATFIAMGKKPFDSVSGSSCNSTAQNDAVLKRDKSPAIGPMPSSPSKVPAWAVASAARSPALRRALLRIRRHGSLCAQRNFQALAVDGLNSHAGKQGSAEPKAPSRSQSFPTQKRKESEMMVKTSSNVKSEPKVILGMGSNVKPQPKVMLGGTSNVKPEWKVMVGASSDVRPVTYPETVSYNPAKRVKLVNNGYRDGGMEVLREMPSVTTIGDGPNGRKIEGFLYRYRKGQIIIVCICHGSFLSPAEFVKHAGGVDVVNPMKRITVSQSFPF